MNYHIESILNHGTSAHPVDHWHKIITTIQDIIIKETRLKITIIYSIDDIHGTDYTQGVTLFPQDIGMATTLNPGLMQKNVEITVLIVNFKLFNYIGYVQDKI